MVENKNKTDEKREQWIKETEKELREAVKRHPNRSYEYYFLAGFLRNLGRNDEAEKVYREGIRLSSPKDYILYLCLGNLLNDLNRYEEAEKEYRETIRLNPNDAYVHNELGDILKKLNRYEEAEKEYGEAKRLGYKTGFDLLFR